MKYVWSIFMYKDPIFVVVVVGVSADVRSAVDEEDGFVRGGRKAFGKDAAGEARSDDDVVENRHRDT